MAFENSLETDHANSCIFFQLELSSGKTRKHKEIESNRRYVMKKMYSALAKMVLKYNPDIKQKFIKFVSDSTVQLPKIMILLGVSIAWQKFSGLLAHLSHWLKAMNHTSSKNPQIQKLLEKCHELLAYKEIALCWIPSHIGIQGNEMVDKQAKTSLSLEPTSFEIPFSNFKPSINKYILEEWQTSWNNSIGNKLLDIKPTIGEYQSVVRNIRREEVILARLRLGHTRVTQSHLLQGEEQPQCVGCDAPFTVRHFLLECGDFAQVRNNCFHVRVGVIKIVIIINCNIITFSKLIACNCN